LSKDTTIKLASLSSHGNSASRFWLKKTFEIGKRFKDFKKDEKIFWFKANNVVILE